MRQHFVCALTLDTPPSVGSAPLIFNQSIQTDVAEKFIRSMGLIAIPTRDTQIIVLAASSCILKKLRIAG
jgi:hypothetical protein